VDGVKLSEEARGQDIFRLFGFDKEEKAAGDAVGGRLDSSTIK